MSPTVVVLGDALLDVRVAPADPVRRGSDVPARIDLLPGGQGANVAVRLARLGVAVSLVTGLARDRSGEQLRATLESEGIDLCAVPVESTGTVVVLAERDGERTMLSQRPALAHLVDLHLVPDAPWLVVSGYLLHEAAGNELARALATRAGGRRALLGCAVPDRAVDGWRRAAAALDPDLLLANRDEAVRLGQAGARGMAVTDASGATLTIAGVTVNSSAPAAAARDTTGAGDAVAAGLLAGLVGAPWPPPRQTMLDAIEAAVALGSRVARVTGAQGRVGGERSAGAPA